MKSKSSGISGSCLCGAIRFEIDTPPICINNCHCSQCRKASGAAFGSFLHTRIKNFKWISGQDLLTEYRSGSGGARPFCGKCGSRVPVVNEDENHVIVPAGTLDGDPGAKPTANIHMGSKAPWYDAGDGPSSYDEDAPDVFWNSLIEAFDKR